MTEKYSREILRRNVAQICQTIGWSGITATPLDILVHVLELYIRNLGARSSRYAEQFNRTQPNLHDLGLVFRDLNINLPELHDFTKCVPPVPPPVSTEKYPKHKESNLNFLKPGSHEVVTRPMHVYDYLPPMYPDKERDQPTLVADTIEIQQNGLDTTDRTLNTCTSPEISVTDSPEKQKDIFKRPIDPVGMPNSKRQRLRLEDEDCRTREIKSVMMTMSGFLSPAREGKLPEAKTPAIIYDKHDKQKPMTNSNLIKVPATMQSSEKSDKKSKKNKSVNGKVMKNKKRDKTHKSDNKHKPDKVDRPLPGFPTRPKDIQSQNHIGSSYSMPRPYTNLPVPKPVTIKQEPLDHSQFPLPPIPKDSPRAIHPDNIPVPKRIPKSQSPLVPNNLHTHKAQAPSSSLIPQDQIKKEPIEEEEKLASQPDRSKINIFKRISNKSKEDKNLSEVVPDKTEQISRLNASHSLSENRNSVGSSTPIEIKTEPTSKNGEINNMDVFKTPDLTANEVISIDDDSMEYNPLPHQKITPPTIRKDLFESPKIMPRKMDELLASSPNASSSKVKKEKKHKDKKDKLSMEKAVKILRKQQQQLAYEMAMQHSDKSNIPFPIKTPRSRASKGESKVPQMPPGFPFFPSMSGRGLMPGPGLIPNPGLIPGADLNLLASLNNPALRGLAPNNLMGNPYALPVGGPGFIPGPNFMPGGSGMMPQTLPNHIMQMATAGQSSRSAKNIHPLLRRPSLEVIPVDDDNRKAMIHESLQPPIREKERHDKHKMSSIPNILQKHAHKSKAKSNQLSKMPFIQPDVTIELNPPKRDPPNIPVPVLVPVKKEPKEPVPPPVEQPTEMSTSSSPEPFQDSLPSEPETSSSIVSKDKSEKKKDKLHKKEKRDKDGIKIKKKKDKKDKSKHKSEKSKEKEGSVDKELKDKIKKEKKEKKKDKEKPPVEAIVPKLTLKLGSASPMPPSSPEVFKLNIKPVVKKDPDTPKESSPDPSRSPEVAQFAALVTRPPKQKHSKSNHVSPEEPKSSSSHTESGSSPTRKNKPPGSIKKTKLFFKTMTKKGKVSDAEDAELALIAEDSTAQTKVDKKPLQLSTPYYTDEHGNKVWVCPACGTPDNGSPMIGCDGCDGWYHWVCVGITKDPGSTEDWFCKSCIAKRTAMATALAGGIMSGKKRGRKSKTDKP